MTKRYAPWFRLLVDLVATGLWRKIGALCTGRFRAASQSRLALRPQEVFLMLRREGASLAAFYLISLAAGALIVSIRGNAGSAP